MTAFLIWGGGGHGKVVADLIRAVGGRVEGFIDRDPAKLGTQVEPGGGRVVMLESDLLDRIRNDHPSLREIASLALGIGDNRNRLEKLGQIGGLEVPPLVHPSATVSPSVTLGRGTVVFAGAVINADARLGNAVIVNTAAVVEHDCVVGDGAHLSPGSVLTGAARIGTLGWLGAGATVLQGLSIGDAAVVGAGAVVTADVPDERTAVGVPAKLIPEKRSSRSLT